MPRAPGADVPSAAASPLSVFGWADPDAVISGVPEASLALSSSRGLGGGCATAAMLLSFISPAVVLLLPGCGVPIGRLLPLRCGPGHKCSKYSCDSPMKFSSPTEKQNMLMILFGSKG
ncbi:UNVERIFIED_CONTAM: hypothetical protein K2H54_049308 [Gekko kuhli]